MAEFVQDNSRGVIFRTTDLSAEIRVVYDPDVCLADVTLTAIVGADDCIELGAVLIAVANRLMEEAASAEAE